jgi:hypothetical protein
VHIYYTYYKSKKNYTILYFDTTTGAAFEQLKSAAVFRSNRKMKRPGSSTVRTDKNSPLFGKSFYLLRTVHTVLNEELIFIWHNNHGCSKIGSESTVAAVPKMVQNQEQRLFMRSTVAAVLELGSE